MSKKITKTKRTLIILLGIVIAFLLSISTILSDKSEAIIPEFTIEKKEIPFNKVGRSEGLSIIDFLSKKLATL